MAMVMEGISMKGGKLLAVIADEVSVMVASLLPYRPYPTPVAQDTCTGFLLGGIGELNNKREPNFLVVDKGKYF